MDTKSHVMGFCKKLSLAQTATDLQVTVEDGEIFQGFGYLEEVPIYCGSGVVQFNFLVVCNIQFDTIMVSPTLASLKEKLGFRLQQVTPAVHDRAIPLPLLIDPSLIDRTDINSEYLTSPRV